MTNLVWTFLALLAGIAGGLGVTAWSVDSPPNFGVVEAGAWITRPKVGSTEADPYSRALHSAQGTIPLGASEGVELTAAVDSAGRRLTAECAYRFHGPVPASRYWTLTAYRHDGRLVGDGERRSAFTSAEVVRNQSGNAEIWLAATPRPGNWIPLPPDGAIDLSLRLYDTQFSSNARAIDAASVPRLDRESCQ
ncbi:MAG TPA: DUF1214 domain-containing protein [Beijerinckiaceae bacterium]|nr:DUF1214 domain-containing protein [Beijerinckiaceae bacterium]